MAAAEVAVATSTEDFTISRSHQYCNKSGYNAIVRHRHPVVNETLCLFLLYLHCKLENDHLSVDFCRW